MYGGLDISDSTAYCLLVVFAYGLVRFVIDVVQATSWLIHHVRFI
jgi:hypothetical protein